MNILEQIIADKRLEVAEKKEGVSVDDLRQQTETPTARPGFIEALRAKPMGLIAEVKRRSPSAGLIRDPFNPGAIAKAYEDAGASAVSCLMDRKYFGGGAEDFQSVRSAIELPMLYKEFVVDPWQIAHAGWIGASAVLLIAGVLTDRELMAFIEECHSAGLCPLVEVHNRDEMMRSVNAGALCIGINNRNLKTFETRLETTHNLASLSPPGCTLISESGIRTPEDVLQVKSVGAHAVLVGESLLREPSPGDAVAKLMRLVWR